MELRMQQQHRHRHLLRRTESTKKSLVVDESQGEDPTVMRTTVNRNQEEVILEKPRSNSQTTSGSSEETSSSSFRGVATPAPLLLPVAPKEHKTVNFASATEEKVVSDENGNEEDNSSVGGGSSVYSSSPSTGKDSTTTPSNSVFARWCGPGCFGLGLRVLGFWGLVAGTIYVGMQMMDLHKQGQHDAMEEQVRPTTQYAAKDFAVCGIPVSTHFFMFVLPVLSDCRYFYGECSPSSCERP